MATPRKGAIIPRSSGDSARFSSRAEVPARSDQARELEPSGAHDLLVAKVAGNDLPHGFALDAFGDRRPARDLVGLVRLDRAPAQAQVADARADAVARRAAVAHAADAHHVTSLLVVGIGMEQVI